MTLSSLHPVVTETYSSMEEYASQADLSLVWASRALTVKLPIRQVCRFQSLATALGPNHADVHVQSDLNFDQQSSTSITNKLPAGSGTPIPQQQSTSDEKFSGPGSGGVNGWPYYLLASTNLALPPAQWTRIATNQFDTSGNFIFTNPLNPGSLQMFYLLQLAP